MSADRPPEAAAPSEIGLDERLEAYEDYVDSEVGDTTLSRARHLERETGLRQLFLKFEGSNPTGTQKDRIAFAQAMDAMRRGFDAVTVATCGNYGAAMSVAAKIAGLRCLIYIPADYHTRRGAEMAALGSEVLRVPGDYEAAVAESRRRAERDGVYDANPGGENVSIQLQAYGEIAWEIYDDLRDAPAVVALPVSNGTTLAGVYRGFLSLYRRGKTSRMPRFCAASAAGMNPIVAAWQRGETVCEDLDPQRIRETQVNEPLINWHSIDGELALRAVGESGGWAGAVSDRRMLRMAARLRDEESLNVLPAATAGLVALLGAQERDPLPGDRYVAILTGRKK